MLFFPVWYQSHFFLVVGYPKGEKWHFYNSLDSDVYWKYTRHFVLFITGVFSQLGWDNPAGLPIIPYECPKQDNTDDCELFVMAYAKHLLLGRPMQFTQSDMWFYRQKIIHDIFYKQWENSGFLECTTDD
ncbi:hypothetical protein CKAN_00124200 [Cinnamomum micranthum f. kanehirae]|uniref:Ubiquitin-like protease family profile domain-containing protein n=1 Tax=Cinnamomum micranthum f. kanehirae TaxID=337451 RepID=A0A3S3MQG9_9MAGN|nr:hypothetical protein CKAN_00124200 [Cinnamomum micranthum f. kanehirae]